MPRDEAPRAYKHLPCAVNCPADLDRRMCQTNDVVLAMRNDHRYDRPYKRTCS